MKFVKTRIFFLHFKDQKGALSVDQAWEALSIEIIILSLFWLTLRVVRLKDNRRQVHRQRCEG